MKIIHKKVLPEYFDALKSGIKGFELRKDEDDIQVGDTLILEEFNEIKQEYTGQSLSFKVKYTLRNCEQYGLKDGFVIIGF